MLNSESEIRIMQNFKFLCFAITILGKTLPNVAARFPTDLQTNNKNYALK